MATLVGERKEKAPSYVITEQRLKKLRFFAERVMAPGICDPRNMLTLCIKIHNRRFSPLSPFLSEVTTMMYNDFFEQTSIYSKDADQTRRLNTILKLKETNIEEKEKLESLLLEMGKKFSELSCKSISLKNFLLECKNAEDKKIISGFYDFAIMTANANGLLPKDPNLFVTKALLNYYSHIGVVIKQD